jgi:hypothetical protein
MIIGVCFRVFYLIMACVFRWLAVLACSKSVGIWPRMWLRGGLGQAVVDRPMTWFQVVNRMVISRRCSSACSRWGWGRKCGDIPLNAARNRCAPSGEVNFFIARSRWRVG